jgi:hypothetical protein
MSPKARTLSPAQRQSPRYWILGTVSPFQAASLPRLRLATVVPQCWTSVPRP